MREDWVKDKSHMRGRRGAGGQGMFNRIEERPIFLTHCIVHCSLQNLLKRLECKVYLGGDKENQNCAGRYGS